MKLPKEITKADLRTLLSLAEETIIRIEVNDKLSRRKFRQAEGKLALNKIKKWVGEE